LSNGTLEGGESAPRADEKGGAGRQTGSKTSRRATNCFWKTVVFDKTTKTIEMLR